MGKIKQNHVCCDECGNHIPYPSIITILKTPKYKAKMMLITFNIILFVIFLVIPMIYGIHAYNETGMVIMEAESNDYRESSDSTPYEKLFQKEFNVEPNSSLCTVLKILVGLIQVITLGFAVIIGLILIGIVIWFSYEPINIIYNRISNPFLRIKKHYLELKTTAEWD